MSDDIRALIAADRQALIDGLVKATRTADVDRLETADQLHMARERLRRVAEFARTLPTDQRDTLRLILGPEYDQGAAPCPGSGQTVSRWHSMPGPFDAECYADATDPGPYADGERVTCPRCSADVPVTPIANTLRSAGRQYVARLAQH